MRSVPRWVAGVWMTAGAVGMALALTAAVFGFSFVSTSTSAAVESIDLGVEVLDTVGQTASVLDRTFGDVADSLRSVQRTVTDGAVTLTQVAKVTGDMAELIGSDVPDGIDAIRATMPSLISTAGVVDTTMHALSFVGVDYDPDVPLDLALVELDAELAAIPRDLRRQQPVLEQVADGLSDFGGDTLVIGDDLAGIRARLTESEVLLDQYTTAATRAGDLLASLRDDVERQGRIGRWLVLVLGLAVAIGQSLPLVAGWQAWSAGDESDRA